MELRALISAYPRLWHATFPGGWDSIRAEGLRPANDLLASVGRGEVAEEVRSGIVTLSLPGGTVAVLRDQKPGRKNLDPYLDGVTAEEWWDLLNRRVYLFPSEGPLERLLKSYAGRGFGQEVITFDTAKLLAPVADRIEVASVNAGVFPRASGRTRGINTFQRLVDADYPVGKVKEVTVVGHLPVPDSAVVKVVAHGPTGVTRRLFA